MPKLGALKAMDVQSIGIALVLGTGVAEGLRQINRDMALFGNLTDDTAARMGRLAQRQLAPIMMREAVQKPTRPSLAESPVTARAPQATAPMHPEQTRAVVPKLPEQPRPAAPRLITQSAEPSQPVRPISSPTAPVTVRSAPIPSAAPPAPPPKIAAVTTVTPPARALAPRAAPAAPVPAITATPVAAPPVTGARPAAAPPRISIALSSQTAPTAAAAPALPAQATMSRNAAPRIVPTAAPPPPQPSAPEPITVATSALASRAPRALASVAFAPVAPTSAVERPSEATRFDRTITAAPEPQNTAAADGQAAATSLQGDVMLDGMKIGRWISGMMAREAARPPTSARGFNTRMTPAWPGTPL